MKRQSENYASFYFVILESTLMFISSRWQRCMQQLAGNENRPKQLGDTGIIVLTKCEQGPCDCNQVLTDANNKKNKNKAPETPKTRRPFQSIIRDVPDRRPIITR